MPNRYITYIVALATVIVVAGCFQEKPAARTAQGADGPTPELRAALPYKTAIEGGRRRILKEAFDFGQAAGKACSSGEDSDIMNMDELLVRLKSSIKTVQEETKGLIVPPGPAARELSEAMEKYLKDEEHYLSTATDELVELVKNKEMSRAQRLSKFFETANRVSKQSNEGAAKLKAAQDKFAKENNIDINK